MSLFAKSLSVEQALALLPLQPEIHTILHTPVSDTSAHWDRAIAEARIRESTLRQIPGRIACTSGHGLVIRHENSIYFLETQERSDAAHH